MFAKVKLFMVLALFGFISVCSAQWIQTIQKTSRYEKASALAAFDSENAAYLMNDRYSSIIRTFDGGLSWSKIELSLLKKYERLNDLEMIDKDKFIVVSGKGRIFRTEDGGKKWEIVFDGSDKAIKLNYLEMFDELNGMAVGDFDRQGRGIVSLTTSDGGYSWKADESNLDEGFSGDYWRRIDFINPEKGYFYISGLDPQTLMFSKNGGRDWEKSNTTGYIQSVKFADENFGVCVTLEKGRSAVDNKIIITKDGGLSWETSDQLTSGWGQDIEFSEKDASTIFVSDGHSIYVSRNAGESWNTDNSIGILERRIIDIESTADNYLWVLQDKGQILRKNLNENENEETESFPENFVLAQNYPNPFNPTTVIEYSLPVKSQVGLKVYDLLGKEISELVNDVKPAGTYKINFTAQNLSSGIYFYKLETSSFVDVKKMLLIK